MYRCDAAGGRAARDTGVPRSESLKPTIWEPSNLLVVLVCRVLQLWQTGLAPSRFVPTRGAAAAPTKAGKRAVSELCRGPLKSRSFRGRGPRFRCHSRAPRRRREGLVTPWRSTRGGRALPALERPAPV